jgi:sterol desaturase/sphingolipid hydroxylase (fatty acid hydroxylase superfamily)
LYVPGSAIPFGYGVFALKIGLAQSAGLWALGFIGWTLAEYWLHRTVFHREFAGQWGQRIHFWIHGVHHQWPKDKYRLVMPPAVSLSLYFIFAGLFYLALGPRFTWPFHSGFVAGYLVYDMTHFATHHLRPLTAWGRQLRRHHLLHHFKDPKLRFGVSTFIWDWVFGTMPNRSESAARSN